jgi:hypothetical protein
MTTLHDLRAEPRPMWQALAHQLVLCKPGDARLPLLNRLYLDMSYADRLRTLAELHACRQARRYQALAQAGAVIRLPDGAVP